MFNVDGVLAVLKGICETDERISSAESRHDHCLTFDIIPSARIRVGR